MGFDLDTLQASKSSTNDEVKYSQVVRQIIVWLCEKNCSLMPHKTDLKIFRTIALQLRSDIGD